MNKKIDLYELLPAFYRLRDAERGYPLRALLNIISEQADIIKQNIDGLWDDFFIETADEWVIPYIGDLVGNNPLHDVGSIRRADVAKTIYYRRRKGTLPMLEELARDVTGWGAHAVAFFELLGWTQNLNHLRFQMAANPDKINPNAVDRVGTVNLRHRNAVDLLDRPFDIISHTVDVRSIDRTQGWYNIRKIGFFLWRLKSYRLTSVTPRQADNASDANGDYGYYFSPLGNPIPLFNNPEREIDPTGLATEIHVPEVIRSLAFYFDLDDYRTDFSAGETAQSNYYGDGGNFSILVKRDGVLVPAESIVAMSLKTWSRPPQQLTYKDADGADVPVAIVAGIDVCRGRLAFALGQAPTENVEVDYHYGFSADMGGGPYNRSQNLAEAVSTMTVGQHDAADYKNLVDALTARLANPSRDKTIITITDNGTYQEQFSVNLLGSETLVIQADDGKRPTLRFVDATDNVTALTVTGIGSTDATLVLNGLLIEGTLHIEANSLGRLKIGHCTLLPGRELDEYGNPETDEPSLIVEDPNGSLEVEIDHSIVGALRLPSEITCLNVKDSIIDSHRGNAQATQLPALISGNLSPFPTLSSTTPTVRVTIADEGTHEAVLSNNPADKPTTLTQARDRLQQAIQAAHSSPAFTKARVLSVSNRLVILSGTAGVVTIETAQGDATATELRLDRTSAYYTSRLVSGTLSPFPTLTALSPMVDVTMGTEGPYTATLTGVPASLTQARNLLQTAIRTAHTDLAFTAARVATIDNQLIVLSGAPDTAVVFNTASTDQTTLTELALESNRPAIAFTEGGDEPGPPTTLERTTVFGTVYVKELTLASEVIFTDPVFAQRRQAGCVRFSHVPEGSQTPRRYRCQPNLALEDVTDPTEAARIRARLTPSFTSVHYGAPAYAQLSLNCAAEIKTGAENSAEMGAFNKLLQPQREANLRIRLEEYLPFGLEAGLIYIT